ncbi:MAG: zinc-ribbon domain-containing protein [Gemmataceae bacterium]|nr:zinc-ribbon domain-containing protein [Gemmataceae bacterium]
MPMRITCPDCSAALSVPDGPAGSVVRCPGCQVRLVVAGPLVRDDRGDERSRGRGPAQARFPVWAAVLFGVLLVGTVGGGVFYAVRGKGGAKDAPAAGKRPGSGGVVKYVPRESEEGFKALMIEKGNAPITEAEVLATMGEPTRRGSTKFGDGPGFSVTAERWEWKAPGSGIESSMTLATTATRKEVISVVEGKSIRLGVTPWDAGRVAPPPRPARPEGASER